MDFLTRAFVSLLFPSFPGNPLRPCGVCEMERGKGGTGSEFLSHFVSPRWRDNSPTVRGFHFNSLSGIITSFLSLASDLGGEEERDWSFCEFVGLWSLRYEWLWYAWACRKKRLEKTIILYLYYLLAWRIFLLGDILHHLETWIKEWEKEC